MMPHVKNRYPLRSRACAPPDFGSTAGMVGMAVREHQMPDVSAIVGRFLDRSEDGFCFIWPSSIHQEQSIMGSNRYELTIPIFNCHRRSEIRKTFDMRGFYSP